MKREELVRFLGYTSAGAAALTIIGLVFDQVTLLKYSLVICAIAGWLVVLLTRFPLSQKIGYSAFFLFLLLLIRTQ